MGGFMNKIILTIISMATFCIADQRFFVWTYEYKTVDRGEVEFEHYYTTSHPNLLELSNGIKIGHQFELEIGMNERFDFAIYHQFEQQIDLRYKGYKLRGRYRIGEKNKYLLDPVLYMEYHGKPDFSKHGIETKLILAKESGRFIASLNPVLEIEIENDEKKIEILRTPLGGFINHSNEANIVKVELHDDRYRKIWTLVALRNIKPEEELTVRYTFYNI